MTDRDQVAREVLTALEVAIRVEQDEPTIAQRVAAYRDTHYPAPAAPVTVTVDNGNGMGVRTVTRGSNGQWLDGGRLIADAGSPLAVAYDRIAELESEVIELRPLAKGANDTINDLMRTKELLIVRERERDEARRALAVQLVYSIQLQRLIEWLDRGGMDGDDAMVERDLCTHHATKADRIALRLQAATSQGEGQQERLAAVAPSPASAEDKQGSPPAPVALSPAPIPLGAVVESVQYEYRFGRYTHDWVCMQGDPPVGLPVDVEISALCTALYHALHPVADRATVERVLQAFQKAYGKTRREKAHDMLRALGYTIQEVAE